MVAVLFAAIGLVAIAVFTPWNPPLPRVPDYLGRQALVALLSIVMLAVQRNSRVGVYGRVAAGLLILAVAVLLDWVFSRFLIDSLGMTGDRLSGAALLKLHDCAIIAAVVIVGARISGDSLGSLYIQKGRLRQGLTTGLIAFAVCVAGAVPMARLMFNGRNLTLSQIVPWIPWILLFVLANATLEELLFRGLFLRRLEPFYGKFGANLLIAVVFTALHGAVTYTPDRVLFLAIVFPLALVWGHITQKTEGLWGSILFHAGTDIPIVLGLFSVS